MIIWRRGDPKPANWPQWLKDADIEWCKVDINDIIGVVVWHDGVWNRGEWREGIWDGGEWRGGIWSGGEWNGGVWRGGFWNGGRWHGGRWHGGDNFDRSVNQALVGWSAHGEFGRVLRAWDCPGRKTTMYSCGCFFGSRVKLTEFIYADEERYRESRLRALAYVDAMLKDGRKTTGKESNIFNVMLEKFKSLFNKEAEQ